MDAAVQDAVVNPPLTIQGVTIGDVFKTGKHTKAKVVDIHEQRSLLTGEFVRYVFVAQGLGLATNRFETYQVSIMRNKVGPETRSARRSRAAVEKRASGSYREEDIVHEGKHYRVLRHGQGYYQILANNGTHSVVVGHVSKTDDDPWARATAIADCDRREALKNMAA